MTDRRDEVDLLKPPPTLRELGDKIDSVLHLVEKYTVVGGKPSIAVSWVQAIGVCCQGIGTLAIAAVGIWLALHIASSRDEPRPNNAVFTAARMGCE